MPAFNSEGMNQPNEEQEALHICLQLIMEIKWRKGYKCRKCDHKKWVKGRTRYYRRCASCRYDESALAHTPLQGKRLEKQAWVKLLYGKTKEEQLKMVRKQIDSGKYVPTTKEETKAKKTSK